VPSPGVRLDPARLASLRERPVLVTGATGFIGGHLARTLHSLGADVHATTRRPVAPPPFEGPTWHTIELTDAEAIDGLLREVRPGVVLHLASRVQGSRDQDLALTMLDDNTRAAVALMTAAQHVPGCRVVLAGSMEESHDGGAPPSPYAAAKQATTGYAQLFHDQWELPVTVLRIAMVYGPEQPDRTKLVPYAVEHFLAGEAPELGSGTRPVDWVYVDDVVEAFLRAATDRRGAGLVADIGTGTTNTIRDVVTELADLTGWTGPVHFGERSDRRHEPSLVADTASAREALDWCARTGLRDGLARTVAWHRGHAVPAQPGPPEHSHQQA
jgi:UDP-glucose 4-epimerase